MENKYDVHLPVGLDLNDDTTTTGSGPVVVKATNLAQSEYIYSIWHFETTPHGPRLRGLYRQGIIDTLQANGFYKRYLDERSYCFIREKDHLLEPVEVCHLKDFLWSYVQNEGPLTVQVDKEVVCVSKEKMRETYLKQHHLCLNAPFLENLANHTIPLLRDTADIAYLPYRNTVVRITGHSPETISYTSLADLCIWRSQVIDRDFDYAVDFNGCHFDRFIRNVAGQNIDRICAFITAIGYLLHAFNHASMGQAVLIYDEVIADLKNPSGGTGKGLLGSAVGHVKPVVKLDGKKFSDKDKFAFQGVTPQTQVIFLDDVKADLPFDRFNSLLTDGLEVEQKFRPSLRLSPQDSPKLLIASNSVLDCEGTTRKRRQFILEFSDHYSSRILDGVEQPILAEHGALFFEGWDAAEWQRFDTFMVYCVGQYLERGLQPYALKNVGINRLRQTTSEEFYTWVMAQAFEVGREYETKPHFEAFKLATGVGEHYKQVSFTRQLHKFAGSQSWGWTTRASNGITYFKFTAQQERK